MADIRTELIGSHCNARTGRCILLDALLVHQGLYSHVVESQNLLCSTLILKLEGFTTACVNKATSVTTTLLLILLLGETFSSRYDQVIVGSICIIITHILVT